MEIDMTKITTSTQVAAYGYDEESKTLAIEFKNGGLYHYAGVEPEKFERLRNAESIGRFIHAEVKSQHTATRIQPDVPQDTQ